MHWTAAYMMQFIYTFITKSENTNNNFLGLDTSFSRAFIKWNGHCRVCGIYMHRTVSNGLGHVIINPLNLWCN